MILTGILLFVLLVSIDQYSKIIAAASLKGTAPFVLIRGVLELRYLENHGAAFGIMQNGRIFFTVVALVVLAVIAVVLRKAPTTRRFLPFRICLVFLAAGAVGNLIDRVRFGYVRDFIYFSLINFPIFNVADIYVTVCTFLLAILLIVVYKDEELSFLSLSSFLGKGGKTGE